MAINKFVNLFGTNVFPQLPITYERRRIWGLDTRDTAGDLQLVYRARKQSFTLVFPLQTEDQSDALILLANELVAGPFIAEDGVDITVVARDARKILTHANQTASLGTYTVEIDLEEV